MKSSRLKCRPAAGAETAPLRVLRGDLGLHPLGNRRLAEGEQGFLEVLVRSVIQETQGAAAGGGIVDDLGHEGLVVAEIQLVADADLAGRVHDHVPQALFAVELAEQEDDDVGPRLLLLAVQARGKDFGVVEDEGVALAEIVHDVLEKPVFDFSGILVEDHHAGFVPPADRLLGDAVLRQLKCELR